MKVHVYGELPRSVRSENPPLTLVHPRHLSTLISEVQIQYYSDSMVKLYMEHCLVL